VAFNLGDMGGIVKQAQEIQKKMQNLQKDLKERVVEASSGGGMVTVQATGGKEVVTVRIKKEAVDPNDLEMLEDLVVAAVNAALKKADELYKSEMSRATGGLNIPGMF